MQKPAGQFVDLKSGHSHSCAIRADGIAECWGTPTTTTFVEPDVPSGTNVEVIPTDETTGEPAPLELTFENVTTPGTVSVTSGQVGDPGAPAGPGSANFRLGNPPIYYDIKTTAVFTGSVRVCVTYPEDAFQSTNNLKLVHLENGDWVPLPGQSVDAQTRTVCANTTSFSEFMIAETEVAPVVTQVTLSAAPVPINTATTLAAIFTDENLRDVHTGSFQWTGGSAPGVITETSGSGTMTAAHAFSLPGVYTITARVSDGDLEGTRSSILETPAFVVVYDPSGGFVTGGGWFDSPAGACLWSGCAADGSTTGKAQFGFVSRYQKGAITPTGNTEFQFKAGGLSFKSTSYQWLVVAGSRAQYKGVGEIAGSTAAYGFLITAIDGGAADRFRIKLWDVASGAIIYDNQIGTTEDSDAATALGGGSIVIHK